jgi:hypothetical protein
MKSSAFMLYIITGLLGYAHKIPFIGRIVTLLSLWYGRTTWWKILVKMRKVFIIFNAIIGVYMVFKTANFGPDNILAGFSAMGHTYLEIFINFTRRIFNWFVELFDYKVVPNVPGSGGNASSFKSYRFWSPRGIESSWYQPLPDITKVPDILKSPFNININTPTPWYRDLSTWIFLASGISFVAVCYIGYKFVMDPLFISNL